MHSACDARVEGMDCPQDLEGFLGVGNRGTDQSGLYGALLVVGAGGTKVPGGWHHLLIVLDLTLLDIDPVAEGPA